MDSDSSSDDEMSGNMNYVADLVWAKFKNDNKGLLETAIREAERIEPCDAPKTESRPNFAETVDNVETKPNERKAINNSGLKTIVPSSVSKTTGTEQVKPKKNQSASLFNICSSEGMKKLYKRKADEALKHVVMKVPTYESVRQKKKRSKLEKSEWKWSPGSWGAMKMAEQTDENKRDLAVLSMRSTIYSKQHLKDPDLKSPKFFQIGTVVDDPASFYSDRIPKKKRKLNLVDELMADKEFSAKLDQQYQEVVETKTNRKAVYQGKAPRRLKNKKKK